MATKKNPLSALLSTDERQQAQEMQREHVLRSSVRQAGTYGVGVQKPLPISQTNLGRLSNSLGTVSGILGQFSAYQAQKEQVELKGQGLQSKLNLQEIASKEADLNLKGAMIQGDILDETVKQQSMKLEEAQTRRADAEWDYMLSQANDAQVEKMIEEANEQVRRQKAKLAKAEIGVEQANPGEHTESPLYGPRALRLLGATYAEEYDEYHRQQTKELIESLADNPNGSNLSREEALDLAQKTMHDFMLLKKLDPEGEVGKGFIQATDRLRAAKHPILASALMDESEALNTQNMIGAMKAYAELGPGQGLLSESENSWFIQLSGMSQAKSRAVLFGTQGDPARGIPPTPGLYGMMARTHEGAVKFQSFFDELSDELYINNKPFRELPEFDSLQAQVEDAVEKTAIDELKTKNAAYSIAWDETSHKIANLSGSMTPEQIAVSTANLINVNDTPDQQREKLVKRFPYLEKQIEQIADDKLPTYAFDLVQRLKGGVDTLDAVTEILLTQAVPHKPRSDRQQGLTQVLRSISANYDTFPGGSSVDISGLIDNFLEGFGEEGARTTAGLKSTGGAFMVGEIDTVSGGVITQYTKDLNNLQRAVLSTLPEGSTQDDFTKAYREGFDELNKNFEKDLTASLIKHSKSNDDLIANLKGNAEARRSSPPFANFVPLETIEQIEKEHPTKTPDEVLELAVSQGLVKEASGFVLSNSFAKSPQEAKTINEIYVSSQKAAKLRLTSYIDEKGAFYKQTTDLTSRVAKRGYGWFRENPLTGDTSDGVVDGYDAMADEMDKAAEGYYSVLVTTEEMGDLASSRVSSYYSAGGRAGGTMVREAYPELRDRMTPKTPSELGESKRKKAVFVVKMGDDFLDIKPYKTLRNAEYEWYYPGATNNLRRDVDGNVNTHEDWPDIRRDVILGHNFFVKHQTPIAGLAFGSAEPTANDVVKISEAAGWSQEVLERVSRAHGYADPLNLLKAQYNNAYYTNQRASNTK